jgi:hypothetical protein
MASIRLQSLSFAEPQFRKLKNLTIHASPRITLIAGHNGIGKSTILGLFANGSGLTDADYQSYFGRSYVANLNEIVHLDYVREFEEPTEAGDELPGPLLRYIVDEEEITKRCALTKRSERREIRVVPRNDPLRGWSSESGIEVGRDAKVPLPTIYLGMTRMLPIGESNPRLVNSAADDAINSEDAEFLRAFVEQVIGTGGSSSASGVTSQSIKGTRKAHKHPRYPYSPKCISLGQDSLGAIATALASFNKLKREWADYPGGLLVVDEIDAGFHPHAQQLLASALKSAARKLSLQVIATTHSLSMIEAVHPGSAGVNATPVDSVVYLTDTRYPRIAEDYTLTDIRRDMTLTPPPPIQPVKAKVLKIYLEDAEAGLLMGRLLTRALKARVKREAGVTLKPMPLSVGCGNLTGLMRHDPYFKTVLIAVDADATVRGNPPNVVKLPGARDSKGNGKSPEWTLYHFIDSLVRRGQDHPEALAALAQQQINTDYLQAHLLTSDVNIQKRESAKKWMLEKQEHIEQWGIIDLWLSENEAAVEKFNEDLVNAALKTAPLL